MSFPTGEEQDLPSISASLHTGAIAQDMVVALTHALHNRTLTARDRVVLGNTAELFRALADPPPVADRLATRHLADTSSTLAAIRAAGNEEAEPETLTKLAETIDVLLNEHDPPPHDQLQVLRRLFLAAGRVNEESGMLTEGRESLESWIKMSTSSASS
jgi:hypothetical protein